MLSSKTEAAFLFIIWEKEIFLQKINLELETGENFLKYTDASLSVMCNMLCCHRWYFMFNL